MFRTVVALIALLKVWEPEKEIRNFPELACEK